MPHSHAQELSLSHTRARHTRRHTTNSNNNNTINTPRSPQHPRTPSRTNARDNLTASKGTTHRPAEHGRGKHEPGDAHTSPGTAATATMAGPRNA